MRKAPVSDESPHILVVDDDDRIRTLLSRFLAEHGYRVSTADNAIEARARLSGLVFDLIVLDVMMPGESGLDLARDLRKNSAIPILMLTARAEIEDRLAACNRAWMIISPSPSIRASFCCASVPSCGAWLCRRR